MSEGRFGPFFPGMIPVEGWTVGQAYKRAILGAQTGHRERRLPRNGRTRPRAADQDRGPHRLTSRQPSNAGSTLNLHLHFHCGHQLSTGREKIICFGWSLSGH